MREKLSHRGNQAFSISNDHATIGYWTRTNQAQNLTRGSGLYETSSEKHSHETAWLKSLFGLSGFQIAGQSGGPLPPSAITSSLSDQGRPPQELTGDFVIACSVDEQLYLVRDHAGCRTLYFSMLGPRLVFASEPKAIWSLPEFSRQLDPDSLLKYLTFSFVPQQPTMLKNLFELPAGHLLHWTGNQYQIRRFFECESKVNEQLENSNPIERFQQVFSKSVAQRLTLQDREPLVFLSGGLDSSVVAAEIRRQHPGQITTFSLHFGEGYPNELSFAKQVADSLHTDHHEALIQPHQFLPQLRQMIWHLDDPIGDPITMPNFELAKRVSDRTDFVFNGEGGDPCLGGPKNLPMMLTHWYGTERHPNFRELAYLESFRRAYEEIDHIFEPAFQSTTNRECLTELLKPFFETGFSTRLLEKLQLINIRLKGAHLILPKVERMLGANGVVPLSPLFSREVVEESFALPPGLKLSRGVEKVVLKELYRDDLPRDVINRPKSGMRVPVHFWFQGEMKKYAKHILSRKELKRAGIFNPDRVKQLLDYNIEEGNGRYGIRLWMLITFEIWRRIVLEGEAV